MKDHPRLIALLECAPPCSYELKFATFGCKGTTIFQHTQTNRNFLADFRFTAFYFQFHTITPSRNFTRLKHTQTRYVRGVRSCNQSSQALCSWTSTPKRLHTYARRSISKQTCAQLPHWQSSVRHEIHKTRARDCSLVSGILTKSVSLSFRLSVHNLTNIFLYFRRKSHGCVRVRTRNYFLYFYILSVYYWNSAAYLYKT